MACTAVRVHGTSWLAEGITAERQREALLRWLMCPAREGVHLEATNTMYDK